MFKETTAYQEQPCKGSNLRALYNISQALLPFMRVQARNDYFLNFLRPTLYIRILLPIFFRYETYPNGLFWDGVKPKKQFSPVVLSQLKPSTFQPQIKCADCFAKLLQLFYILKNYCIKLLFLPNCYKCFQISFLFRNKS